MPTDHSPRDPSAAAVAFSALGSALVAGALLCLSAVPLTASAASAPAATPVPSPTCGTPPCASPAGAQLTLTQTVDRVTAVIGDTVNYTVTVRNTGAAPATAVTVSDVVTGSAGYRVADGTGGTANSFAGQPLVTVIRVAAGRYTWTYPVVSPGDSDVVRFSAVIAGPRGSQPAGTHVITLTSVASAPGATAAVSTSVAYTPRVRGGGVHGSRAGVPPTGLGLNGTVAGFLFLSGLGLLLVSEYMRERSSPT